MHRVLLFTLAGILTFLALSGFHEKWAGERELLAHGERPVEASAPDAPSPRPTAATIARTDEPDAPRYSESAIRESADSNTSESPANEPDIQGEILASATPGERPAVAIPISGDPSFGRHASPPFHSKPQQAETPRDGEEPRPAPAVVQAWGTLLPLGPNRAGDEYFVGRMHMELVPIECDDTVGAQWPRTRERSGLLTDMSGVPLEEVDLLFGQGVGGRVRNPLSMRPSVLLAGPRTAELAGGWEGGLLPGAYRLRLFFEATGEAWEGRLILIGSAR